MTYDTSAEKSTEVSNKFRSQGNEYFRKKDSVNALKSYGSAITYAVDNSEALSLAYGNRSAVLFELQQFEDCAKDVTRAISFAKKSSDSSRISKYNNRLDAAIKLTPVSSETIEYSNQIPLLLNNSNSTKSVSELSSAVDVQISKDQGRCLIAKENIPAGSVVIVEKPVSYTLLPHKYDEYCFHCIKPIPMSWVPCRKCSDPPIKFCTENCRDEASTSHRIECGHVQKLANSGIGHLALKTLIALEDHIEEFDTFAVRDEGTYWNPQSLGPRKIEQLFSLESHTDKIDTESLHLYEDATKSLVGLLIRKYKSGETPRGISSEIESGDPARLCRALVRLIQKLICNAHAITSCENNLLPINNNNSGIPRQSTDQENWEALEILSRSSEKIASALYPVASLMNHSCNPNIFSSFVSGNILVVRTTRLIQKGDQLQNCYGPKVGRMTKPDRQDALESQYYFHCNCTGGCNSEEIIEIEEGMKAYNCKECAAPAKLKESGSVFCVRCGKNCDIDNTSIDALWRKIDSAASPADVKEAVKEAEKLLHPYNQNLWRIRDDCAKMLARQNCPELAMNLLRTNIEGIRKLYGTSSIEVGEELVKLLSLCHSDKSEKNLKEIDALKREAVEIFTAYYGSHCDTTQMLNRL